MSDTPPNHGPKLDPRRRRTRDRLGDALVELIQEQPFDSITVQHVLDRAGVARSTFYANYKDKDDLFQSDADDFFLHMANAPLRQVEGDLPRVAPLRELLEHVADVRPFFAAVVASGRLHDVLDLGRGHFARSIAERLAREPRAASLSTEQRQVLGQALSGAMTALLLAWVRDPAPRPAAELDAFFHGLVWNGVAAGGANATDA
ncbi:MAG: TetR/AcrR family transcriptional regulator [Planctomycetes bacterium]|nr:TetR/AcrR family transcriptional regulator [Planctomycetota bacterium]